MSRCVPFPPSGYVWKVRSDAHIRLLELRREWALAAKRKEKKRRRRQIRKQEKGKARKGDDHGGNIYKKQKHERYETSTCGRISSLVEDPIASRSIRNKEQAEITSSKEEGGGVIELTSQAIERHRLHLEIEKLISGWVPPEKNYPDGDLSWLFNSKRTLPAAAAAAAGGDMKQELQVRLTDDLGCGRFGTYPSLKINPVYVILY
ncbi:hypothetical protein Dimus_026195 [Dionaea muscipula]